MNFPNLEKLGGEGGREDQLLKAIFHNEVKQVPVPLKHRHQQPVYQSLRCDLRDMPARAALMWSLNSVE